MPHKDPEVRKAYCRERWLALKARMASDPTFRAERKAYIKKVKHDYHVRNGDRVRVAVKVSRIRRQYGMTVEEVEFLWSQQDRACAVCRKPEARLVQRHIDHDHRTGRVRGILCGNCNLAIGHMADDPERLRSAAEYLVRTGGSGAD